MHDNIVERENTIILILVGNRIKTPSTEPFVMSCWHEGNLRNNAQTCHLKCVDKEATVFPSLTHVPLSWLDQCAHSCTPFTPPHPWPRGRHLNWQQSMLETGLSSPGRWCESSRRSIPNLGPPPSKHPPLSGHPGPRIVPSCHPGWGAVSDLGGSFHTLIFRCFVLIPSLCLLSASFFPLC